MSQPLLFVFGFCANDAAQCESLLDYTYHGGGKKQSGHCLLVSSHDCHPEMRTKLVIAAEIAFSSVSLTVAPETHLVHKAELVNNLFKHAAEHVHKHYRFPWLWLDPDCVPLKPDWREQLCGLYAAQPKRYFGPQMRVENGPEEKLLLARTSIYPSDAIIDLASYFGSIITFNLLASDVMVPRSTKTRLIQMLNYQNENDWGKIRPDAILLHSDKSGALLSRFREGPEIHNGNGAGGRATEPVEAEPKVDGRTKAGRALKTTRLTF